MHAIVLAAAAASVVSGAHFNPASARAEPEVRALTIGELSQFCRSKDLSARNACRFYILGAFESAGLDEDTYCMPDNLSADRMEFFVRDMMARDLEFHPEDAKLSAIGMVGAVIALRYSCVPVKR